jgi:hypothetical protein
MRIITRLLLFTLFIFLTGCMAILGVHSPKQKTGDQILKAAKKLNIPKSDVFALDTTYYNYIFSFDRKKYGQQIKNHYQPLQALYFDRGGSLVKFYINCYAGGTFKLNWDREGRLQSFLPKDQAPLDTLLDLTKQLRFLKPLSTSNPGDLKTGAYDFTVIIYWNIFMRRYSKHLIKEIRKNIALANGKTVKVIYLNTDNFFVLMDK